MSQSKIASLTESLTNVGIGYVTAVCAQFAIFPLFNIDVAFTEQLGIAFFFTCVSIVRSYIIRRFFNERTR